MAKKKTQERKFYSFIVIAKKSVIKNFSLWVRDLVFLGIWADQPFAMCLCRIITDETDTPIDEKYDLYDGYHERYVKASMYMSWL